jgi:predicted ATPase
LPDSPSPSDRRRTFDRRLATMVSDRAEREWLRRRIGPAAGILERPPASPLDDMAEHTEIVAVWSTHLTAVARSRPTILVLDDVHRTDAAFDTLLADCLRPLRALPLLVISTARPDRPERTFQWVTTDSLTLTLHGLEAWETDELLRNLLSDDPVTEAQQAVVRIRSGGNPLYAIHFARMLRSRAGADPSPTRHGR